MSGPTTLAAAIKRKPIRAAYNQIQIKVKLLCKAPPEVRMPLLLIGPSGIGKSSTVRFALQQHGQRVNMGNPRTPPGLYGFFRKYKNARFLLIDDSDHLA